jgi:curved DNA-binding protein CbpA
MEIINSPYEVLDLPVNASLDVVKKQYKTLIRLFPPEQNPDEFNKIRMAYDQINTELFNKRVAFPRYKKAIGYAKEKATPSVSGIDLITTLFETPFNTHFELEKLLEDIVI